MASVKIAVYAGKDGEEELSFVVSEENYLPGDLHNLLAKAYSRAISQVHAWEGDQNATQRS